MAVLTQMLEQQREFYKEMLTQQQENFKCFIQVIMEGANKRLDGVIKDVQELKTSLHFTQGKFDDMMSTHTEMETKMKSVDKSLTGYRQEMDEMLTKLDHMENQHKRKNIIIEGMADEKGENWNDLEQKVKSLFSSHLEQ